MFEQRKASLFSGKENAFVAYKDLKKEVENSAHCFTLEQEVTDMITSTLSTSTLSSVLNCLGEDLYAYEEVTNTFPLVLKKKKINGWGGFYTLGHILHFDDDFS